MLDFWKIQYISNFGTFIISVVIKNLVVQFCSSFWIMFPTELKSKKKKNIITRCYKERTTLKINCASYLSGPFAIMSILLEIQYIW